MMSRTPSSPDPGARPGTEAIPAPPRSLEELEWRPRRMVQWFDPRQLTQTAIRALLSSVFGRYADKREVQAALSEDGLRPLVHDYSDEGELWIDFTADLGDGFDSTYTIAWLLGQERLPPPPADASPRELRDAKTLARTERGRVLVLGGDQVYPTATRDEYAARFAGPYEAALPWVEEARRPRLFAIPGNHDWYDGLTSFMRLFCQQRWIGGWQTRQTRSYFALKLPQRWWLLGIDIQLEADLDRPQLDYFKRVAEAMQPGDHVILCTAEPAWLYAEKQPKLYDNLAFFERTVLSPRGAKLMLTLTGDLHHYARYSDPSGERHKITAGGGGAYLYGTQLLPESLELPEAAAPAEARTGERSTRFERAAVNPEPELSRRLRWGSLLLGYRNPGFVLFLGLLYSFCAWVLQDASRGDARIGALHLQGWLAAQPLDAIGTVFGTLLRITLGSPSLALGAAAIVVALYFFCQPDPGRPPWLRAIGALHGAMHLALLVLLSWAFAWINLELLELRTPAVQVATFLAEMLLIGGPLGSLLFGLALLPGVNFNEAYACQHIENHKNFLRMHLTPTGTLMLYPIGVDRVKQWEIDPTAQPGAPYFRTRDGAPPRVRLIEAPITIPAAAPPRVLTHALAKERA